MCTKETEYGRAVHFNVPNSEPLRGNSADSGDVGREKVVGEVVTGPVGIVGNDGGIRRGGGGGRDRVEAEGVVVK